MCCVVFSCSCCGIFFFRVLCEWLEAKRTTEDSETESEMSSRHGEKVSSFVWVMFSLLFWSRFSFSHVCVLNVLPSMYELFISRAAFVTFLSPAVCVVCLLEPLKSIFYTTLFASVLRSITLSAIKVSRNPASLLCVISCFIIFREARADYIFVCTSFVLFLITWKTKRWNDCYL